MISEIVKKWMTDKLKQFEETCSDTFTRNRPQADTYISVIPTPKEQQPRIDYASSIRFHFQLTISISVYDLLTNVAL